jgi:predicted DNA-binding protein with PD1-like motif
MKSKLLATAAGQRTFAVIFDTGDEVMAGLQSFAREQQLAGSHFTAIGACRAVTLGYFEWEAKQYRSLPVDEQVEVLSLVGDVSLAPDGQPRVHAHIVVGKADGTAHGGHLLRAAVRPTLEVILTESPTHLQRQPDPDAGIPLIRL